MDSFLSLPHAHSQVLSPRPIRIRAPQGLLRKVHPPLKTAGGDVRERRLAKFRQNVARFRLYRLRFLQENMRFAAFFKIYQILKLKFLKFDNILQICKHTSHLWSTRPKHGPQNVSRRIETTFGGRTDPPNSTVTTRRSRNHEIGSKRSLEKSNFIIVI